MKTKEFGIIGFGNQAKAWALNLQDSGHDITIYLREDSPSLELAQNMGFKTSKLNQVHSSFIALLTPDETHLNILENLKYNNNEKLTILYAHGYSLYYDQLAQKFPQFSHILCAPKAIASELRFQYQTKGNIGGVYSLEKISSDQKKLETWLLSFASDLGLNAFYPATIADETKADLFSEQSLLCSVLPYASLSSFNKLREKGISKEVAFFESWYEVKLIVDTLMQLGPQKFFNLISPNALIGSEIGKDLIFDDLYQEKLSLLYSQIEDKSFLKKVSESNIDEIRQKVVSFWQQQELTETFNQLAPKLYAQSKD
jgi:ketol-acid reductoisomerase